METDGCRWFEHRTSTIEAIRRCPLRATDAIRTLSTPASSVECWGAQLGDHAGLHVVACDERVHRPNIRFGSHHQSALPTPTSPCWPYADGGFFVPGLTCAAPSLQSREMLRGYFDESERSDGAMIVAGCLFLPDAAREFERVWRDLFDPFDGSHWAELTASTPGRLGRFKATTQAQRDELIMSGVRAICDHADCWVSVSCKSSHVDGYPAAVEGYRKAYAICCNRAMLNMARLATDNGRVSRIEYIFEDGHKHRDETESLMGNIWQAQQLLRFMPQKGVEATNKYRYEKHSFVAKAGCVFLQAPDAVAWETGKWNLDRKADRPMRDAMKRLHESMPGRYHAGEIRASELRKFADGINATA
jgi:hypothetical protein